MPVSRLPDNMVFTSISIGEYASDRKWELRVLLGGCLNEDRHKHKISKLKATIEPGFGVPSKVNFLGYQIAPYSINLENACLIVKNGSFLDTSRNAYGQMRLAPRWWSPERASVTA